MKFSTPAVLFFLAIAHSASCGAAAASGALPPMRFEHMPLGNVARVLSARFKVPVTMAANATMPITGDFTGLDLRQALEAAARQAGLVVVPLGDDASAGYSLVRPEDAPVNKNRAALADAARRRAELLKRRALLLDQAATLDAPR